MESMLPSSLVPALGQETEATFGLNLHRNELNEGGKEIISISLKGKIVQRLIFHLHPSFQLSSIKGCTNARLSEERPLHSIGKCCSCWSLLALSIQEEGIYGSGCTLQTGLWPT